MIATSRRRLAVAVALGLFFAVPAAAISAAASELGDACAEFSTNAKLCACIDGKVTDDDERDEMTACYRAAAAAKKGGPPPVNQCQKGLALDLKYSGICLEPDWSK